MDLLRAWHRPGELESLFDAHLEASERLCKKWGRLRLRALRSAAMRQALSHDEVLALSGEVLTVAHAGLERQEQSWLDYALYVWRTCCTAPDVMLTRWRQLAGQPDHLIKFRHAQEVIVVNER